MMVFWVMVAGLVGLALLFILPTLLRPRQSTQDIDLNEVNLAVFRQQMAELDRDLAAGNLDQASHAAARQDLERELLLDIEDHPAAAAARAPSGRWAALALAGLLPLLAVGLYLKIGQPRALDPPSQASAQPGQAPGQGMPSMDDLVVKLAKRMEQDPNNLQGWLMLGRSYIAMERMPDAVLAYEKALGLAPKDVEVLLGLAEALIRTQDSEIQGRPLELIQQAVALEPDHPNALWLMGSAEFQRERYAEAVALWTQLEPKLEPGGEEADMVRTAVQEARQRAGLAAPAATPAAAATAPTPATAQASAVTLEVEVSLAPELAAQAAPEDSLFVFARALQGPPMPLAVQRRQVKDLPVKIRLDDSMAMQPQLKLSGFKEVLVGARISKSGIATPQSGDLQGEVQPVAVTQTGPVQVRIDQVRP